MKNISIKEYSQSQDIRYVSLLKSMKPNDTFAGSKANIGRLPYLEVVNWYSKITKIKTFEDVCSLFCFVFNIEPEAFWGESVVNYFSSLNFIEQDFLNRQEKESKILKGASVDKLKWEAAGGNSLKMFSPVSPLDELAQRYGGDPFDWGKNPYNDVIYLVTMITRKSIVSRNYQKLMNEK